MSKTEVIFRMDPKYGVFAVFPYIIETLNGDVGMYAHVGQHGTGYYEHMIGTSRPATPAEYAPLLRELEGAPFRYDLKIVRQRNRDKFQALWDKVRREHSRSR